MKLTETTFAESLTVDEESGVIHGVKVLGRESKNGRTYSDKAMGEAAALYEGVEVNVDHPSPEAASKPRGVMEGAGWLKAVKVKPDGVYADLHYLKSHPATPLLLERARRNPDKFGLSHNADGQVRQDGPKTIVESIERVHSVDLVRNPATNAGLFESENQTPEKPMKRKLSEIFAGLAAHKPDAKAALTPLLEMDGEYEMAAEPAAAAPTDLKGAFKAACVTVLDDDSLDMAGKIAKIKEILKAEEKLSGKAEEAVPEEKPADDKPEDDPVAEQVALLGKQLAGLAKRQEVADLLEAHGVSRSEIGADRVKKLIEAEDPAALLESWPASITSPRKRPIIAPLSEQDNGLPFDVPKTSAGLAAALR